MFCRGSRFNHGFCFSDRQHSRDFLGQLLIGNADDRLRAIEHVEAEEIQGIMVEVDSGRRKPGTQPQPQQVVADAAGPPLSGCTGS